MYLFILQNIVPRGAVSTVRELFVAEDKKEAAIQEAESLPAVEITKVILSLACYI